MNEEYRALIEETARATAKEACKELMTTLGIDVRHPHESQKDLIALRELRLLHQDPGLQADLLHLRKWRITMENVQSKGVLAIVGFLTLGILSLIWLGIKAKLGAG